MFVLNHRNFIVLAVALSTKMDLLQTMEVCTRRKQNFSYRCQSCNL